jgi:HSP20 family molecular chaperone IbpA
MTGDEDDTTDDAEDARDATDTSTDATDEESGGLASLLRGLLETIVEADSSGRAIGRGRTGIGRGRIGHEFSIGVGTIDDATPDPGSEALDTGATASDAPDHATSVEYNEAGTEALVAVDVPEVGPEDLSAGVSSRNGDLLIGADDAIVERVSHDLTDAELAAASYHNAVLEIHLKERSDRS